MAQGDSFRAIIDVRIILEKKEKEPQNDSPPCGIQEEALKKVTKPRGPYKTKEKVKRVSSFCFCASVYSVFKFSISLFIYRLIQSNFFLI